MAEPTRIDLPSGHWASILHPDDMLGEHYRLAWSAVTDGTHRAKYSMEMRAALLGRCILNWDWHFPLPVAPEILDTLPWQDTRELYGAVMPHWRLIMGISVVPNLDEHEDEASPTEGSSV